MEKKEKLTAGLLALFVGGLGIHKFYLKDDKTGILYLVFCWTGVPAILALIDAINILTMSDDDFNAKYNEQVATSTGQKTSAKQSSIVEQASNHGGESFLANPQNKAQTLVTYKELLDNGTITQDEFDAIKTRILDL